MCRGGLGALQTQIGSTIGRVWSSLTTGSGGGVGGCGRSADAEVDGANAAVTRTAAGPVVEEEGVAGAGADYRDPYLAEYAVSSGAGETKAADRNCPKDRRVAADEDPARVADSGVAAVEPRAAWQEAAHPDADGPEESLTWPAMAAGGEGRPATH